MNLKKLIIILIIILAIAIGALFIVTSSGEIIVNNVAGVNNVKLNSSLFSSDPNINQGNDSYHTKYGDFIAIYTPTGSNMRFNDVAKSVDESNSSNTKSFNFNESDSNTKPLIIAGIKGYYTNNEESGDVFSFIINNRTYKIIITNGTLSSNLEGIKSLLTAWLKASGYNQTWDYPNKTTQNQNTNQKDSSWDPYTGKGTPSYEDYKSAGAVKGDNDVSYEEYQDAMKNWNPNEEHIG